jgi:mono/diheme cytochrome c family protein
MAIAGAEFSADQKCAACHRTGGPADPVPQMRITKDPDWVIAHMADPETIAPGSRKAPPGGMRESQARSIISYLQRVRAGGTPPAQVDHKPGILVYGTWCVRCHTIEGEGVKTGPDLTYAGEKRDAKWLHAWITDPGAVDAKAEMPAFEDRLTPEELTAVVEFLAARKRH